MVTRRVTQRQFLLVPSLIINAILGFCLAVAAARSGVAIHAFAFLSNHVHIVLTDVRGELPKFMHWFFLFTAKCVNAHRGRWENLWDSGKPSVVDLADADAELAKVIYTITNPVAAGLVSTAERWPGLVGLPKLVGRALSFKRPDVFFRPNSKVPNEATLTLQPLPSFADMKRDDYVEMLTGAVAAREEALAAERKLEGKGVLGRRAVVRQGPTDRPKNAEPRRKLSPRIACRDKWTRIEALQRLKAFETSYRKTWQRWRAGDRDVLFPYGTWALRLYAGVRCHGPP